jgi:DNA-binding response OmpR family regulator
LDEANWFLESHSVLAAVLDVDLGGDKVWSVARELANEGVPLLFISQRIGAASELPSDLSHAKILLKPFDQNALGEAIAQVLEQHDREAKPRGWSACLGPLVWTSFILFV